jgi:hypothetical protein
MTTPKDQVTIGGVTLGERDLAPDGRWYMPSRRHEIDRPVSALPDPRSEFLSVLPTTYEPPTAEDVHEFILDLADDVGTQTFKAALETLERERSKLPMEITPVDEPDEARWAADMGGEYVGGVEETENGGWLRVSNDELKDVLAELVFAMGCDR